MPNTDFDNESSTEDKIESSIQKIYSYESDTEVKKVRVLTSKFIVDASTIKQYIVKSKQDAPITLAVESKTNTSITLVSITTIGHGNVEYAISETNSTDNLIWQETTTFDNLTKDKTYYLFARYAGDANYSPSGIASTTCTLTSKLDQEAPSAPTLASATTNSLTINAITTTGHGDTQYAVNTSNTIPTAGWQTVTTFTGLTQGTNYYFFARYAGDDSYNSAVSQGALLGLGYTITIDLQSKYMGDQGDNANIMKITLANKDEIEVVFNAMSFEREPILVDGVELSIPCTISNVTYFYREKGFFVEYTADGVNNNHEEFNNGKVKLDSDIRIVGAGVSSCIDENSLITMWDGSLKAMKDIDIGDEVLSIDYETMTLIPRKVIYTSKDEPNYQNWNVPSYYLHTFSDGTVIKRAMNHRFYCLEDQLYEYMHTWNVGEHTYKVDGTNPYLVSTKIIQEPLHYARITLEGSNNFFANGLATGDRRCCPNEVTLDKKLERAN